MTAAVIPEVKASLQRLINVAQRRSGQSRRVANFLLAWWNAEECGAFDLTDMWGVDRAIAADMVKVFAYVSKYTQYPDSFGFGQQFEDIVRAWRPHLFEESTK